MSPEIVGLATKSCELEGLRCIFVLFFEWYLLQQDSNEQYSDSLF